MNEKTTRVAERRQDVAQAGILMLCLCNPQLIVACGPSAPPNPDLGVAGDAGTATTEPYVPAPPVVGEDIVPADPGSFSMVGSFSVSPDGRASYSLPLDVSPAHEATTPNLSLVYDSRRGDGWMGPGWALGGLSSIEPCPGVGSPSNLCLDGTELVVSSGSYGASGAVYELANDIRVRVRQVGIANNAQFAVERPDGTTSTFGGSGAVASASRRAYTGGTSQRSPVAWLLRDVQDRYGHGMHVQYTIENDDRTQLVSWIPTRISYGGTSVATHRRVVSFHWSPRTTGPRVYRNGSGRESKYLLEQVVSQIDARDVYVYNLEYSWSSTAEIPRLATVTKCDGFGSCGRPTEFDWSDDTVTSEAIPIRDVRIADWLTSGQATWFSGDVVTPGDFDGDGRDDLLVLRTNRLGSTVARPFMLSNFSFGASGASYVETEPRIMPSATRDSARVWRIAAPNMGVGSHDDLLMWDGAYGRPSQRWRRFVFDDAMVATDLGRITQPTCVVDDDFSLLDLTRDGRRDLITSCTPPIGDQRMLSLHVADGSGGFLPPSPLFPLSASEIESLLWLDVDQDGTLDATFEGPSASRSVRLTPTGARHRLGISSRTQLYIDVNQDGLVDAVTLSIDGVSVAPGNGAGFGESYYALDIPIADVPPQVRADYDEARSFSIRTGDFNNDGRADFMLLPLQRLASTAILHISDGAIFHTVFLPEVGCHPSITLTQGLFCQQNDTPSVPVDLIHGRHIRVADLDGDGTPELVHVRPGAVLEVGVLTALRFTAQAATLITKFDDSRNSYRVTYSDAAHLGLHDSCEEGARCVDARLVLVSSTASDDGTRTSFGYQSPAVDSSGKFRGFGQTTAIVTSPNYPAPRTFTDVYEYRPDGGADRVRSTERQAGTATDAFEWIERRLDHTYRSIPSPLRSSASLRVLSRSIENRRIRFARVTRNDVRRVTGFDYDSRGYVVLETQDGLFGSSDKTRVERSYDYRGVRPLLLTENVQSYDEFDEGWDSRTTTFEYVDGELSVVRADAGTPVEHVLEFQQRDSHGNVTAWADVANVERRGTLVGYDPEGIHVAYTRNAAGHESYFATDEGTGAEIAVVDANGGETRTTVDGVGRPLVTRFRGRVTESATYQFLLQGGTRHTVHSPGRPSAAAVYDRHDRLQQRLRTDHGGAWMTEWSAERDDRGHSLRECGERPYGMTTANCVVQTRDSTGSVTSVQTPDGVRTIVSRSGDGFEATISRPMQDDEYRRYDALGRLIRTTTGVGSLAEVVTDYSYGAFNQLRRERVGGSVVANFDYWQNGSLKQHSESDRGSTYYVYNGYGELADTQTPWGDLVRIERDALGRPVSVASGSDEMTYSYDRGPFARGHLSEAASATDRTRVVLEYDPRGHVLARNLEVDSRAYRTEMSYVDENIVSVRHPSLGGDALEIGYSYSNGYPVAVTDVTRSRELWRMTSAANGRVLASAFPPAQTTVGVAYDGVGRGQSLTVSQAGVPVVDATFGYDAAGRLSRRMDVARGELDVFQYDRQSRLASHSLSVGGTVRDVTGVDYDGLGNITALTTLSGRVQFEYDPARPRTVSRESLGELYVHDAGGRRTHGRGHDVEYRYFSLASRIVDTTRGTQTTNLYSGTFELLSSRMVESDEVSVVDYVGPVQVVDGTRGVFSQRVPDGATIRVRYGSGTHEVAAVFGNAVGTAETVLHEGAGPQFLRTSVFGRSLPLTGGTGTRRPTRTGLDADSFAGHRWTEAGLVDLGGRMMDPRSGVFLTPDPETPSPSIPIGRHPFAYAVGVPHLLDDPSGFNPFGGGDGSPGGGGGGFTPLPPEPPLGISPLPNPGAPVVARGTVDPLSGLTFDTSTTVRRSSPDDGQSFRFAAAPYRSGFRWQLRPSFLPPFGRPLRLGLTIRVTERLPPVPQSGRAPFVGTVARLRSEGYLVDPMLLEEVTRSVPGAVRLMSGLVPTGSGLLSSLSPRAVAVGLLSSALQRQTRREATQLGFHSTIPIYRPPLARSTFAGRGARLFANNGFVDTVTFGRGFELFLSIEVHFAPRAPTLGTYRETDGDFEAYLGQGE